MGRDADRGQREHAVRNDRAEYAAGDLRGDVGERITPGDAAEAGVGERDDRVEVSAGDRAEHEDDRERPAAVAAAFSNSCRPASPGERVCAAIPEPITSAARNAEPSNSASRRRASGGVSGIIAGSYYIDNHDSIDICILMTIDLELVPKQKRAAGEPCCEPVVYPDVQREHALRMAEVAKALGDPIRLQLVDVLRKHAGKVCVCELVPLFDISQPTLSHHLKKLRAAGIVNSERQGLWAYYYVIPDALKELSAWLS